MNSRLKRTPGLYLVGFPGSGKATIGRRLADRLGWSFFDLDREMEAAGKTTEAAMLRQHVRSIECGRPSVLALGGGAFADPANRELILQNGIVFWLDCPLSDDPNGLAGLADVRIPSEDDNLDAALETICNHPILK